MLVNPPTNAGLISSSDITTDADPYTATISHGLGVAPDIAFVQFTADPSATGRWHTTTKSSTQTIVVLTGCTVGTTATVYSIKFPR